MRVINPEVSSEQRRGIRLTVAILAGIAAVLTAAFVWRILQPPVLSDAELKAKGAYLFDQPRLVEPFELVAHNGETFNKTALQGHWTLVFFGFTYCPDICPTTMAKLGRLKNQLDPEYRENTEVVMISVDPARDTPEKLAEYVTYFHPDFTGVTGEFMELQKFALNLAMPFTKEPNAGEDYLVAHSGNIALINPQGDYAGFFRPPHTVDNLKLTYQAIRERRD